MRQSAAYLLLLCFGIYHLGHLAVQLAMPFAIHQHWEKRIWADESALPAERLHKIPFPMPYGQDQEEFQAVNFSMEIAGKMTRVIRQRYFDEHLEVVIVPDQLQASLDEQLEVWLSSLSTDQGDFQGSPMQKLLLKSFAKDFMPRISPLGLRSRIPLENIQEFPPFFVAIPDGIGQISLPPPRPTSFS